MASVTFDAEPGITYYIAVDGRDGTNAQFTVSVADLGGGDLPLPAGAVGMLDFLNGVYKWGGSPETTYNANEVVNHPEFIVSGVGAYIAAGGSALGLLAGDFLDHLLADEWSAMIEFSTDGDATLMVTQNGADVPRFSSSYAHGSDIAVGDNDGGRSFFQNDVDGIVIEFPAYNVMAFARANTRIAAQVAEGTYAGTEFESTAGSNTASAATQVHFGGNASSANDAILISRIVFFPATATADLDDLLIDPVLEAPANNAFSGAVALTLDTPVSAHNYRCTAETGEPDHGGTASGNSCWFTFTAPSTGNFTVTVTPTGDFGGWGAVIGVYTGSAVGSLTPVADASDYPGAAVTFSATMGVTYKVAIDGAGGNFEPPWSYRPGHSPFTIEVTT